MSNTANADFITKKQIEELYGRSHRSLTRDFSRAVRTKNTDVLNHLKLYTDDGIVRDGTDVSLEQIQELSNNGLAPTWYVRRQWAEQEYGKRSTGRSSNEPLSTTHPASADSHTSLTADSDALVAILREQLRKSQEDHQHDKEAFREQTKMFKDMFDTLKDDHADTKELLRQVHAVFGHLSQGLLAKPQSNSIHNPHLNGEREVPSKANAVSDAVQVDNKPAQQSANRNTPKKKPPRRKPTSHKRRKATPKKSVRKPDHPKPKWYEMPTIEKIGRSILRR